MKCVTIYQPWAWLFVHGPKRVENRTWRLNHRGPLAVHAGWRQDRWLRAFYDDAELRALAPEIPPPQGLRYGAILGVVDVVDCVLLAEVRRRPYSVDERTAHLRWLQEDPWAEGPWYWIRGETTRPLEWPVPWRGEPGIFEVPDSVLAEHAPSADEIHPVDIQAWEA